MESLKVYIDRLKGGCILKIDETLSPDFLEVDEKELAFDTPVRVQGEAYIANEHLVVHLAASTSALLPCSICNTAAHTAIAISNLYFTTPLSEIHGAIFDLLQEVRESILLQTPPFTECNGGHCPERGNMKKFLKSEEAAKSKVVHFPFAKLESQL